MREPLSRRNLIKTGGRVVLSGALAGTALQAWPHSSLAATVDWQRLFRKMPEGGFGTVKEVKGFAFANQRVLKVGDRVQAGEQLRVAKDGSLVVSAEDHTIIRLNEETVLDFHVGPREGVLALVTGALLAVMPKGRRYLVAGPTATIGIKGTVIFRQVFTPREHTAHAMEGRTATLPAGLNDYFCTCNGETDYLRNDNRSLITTVEAKHHKSFFLNPANPGLLQPFEMINHFDRDIRALVGMQEGPKQDLRFLDIKESGV
ncbi:MAG TPA: FecR domain-containing protein [bacterium]|nr:FecR domain-containing protein [bacterium]